MIDFNEELVSRLQSLREKEFEDPRAIDSLIAWLESSLPEGFEALLQMDREEEHAIFLDQVSKRYLEKWEGRFPVSNGRELCIHFFQILFLLRKGIDDCDRIPASLAKDLEFPSEAVLNRRLHIEPGGSEINQYIETVLYYFGHEHPPGSPAGTLNEERCGKALAALSSQWPESSMFFHWVITYLCLRLIRVLKPTDLFYAIHGELHHYREFKLLVYLLWFLGRGDYAALGQLAELSHSLFYDILTSCRSVFQAGKGIDETQTAVSRLLQRGAQKLSEIMSVTRNAPHVDPSGRIVGVMLEFFNQYIKELSEAGKFHIVLWCLPMFAEVKDAFQSVLLSRGRGFSILLISETGTGKESIAELFLKSSGAPFLKVNCAGKSWESIARDLFEINETDGGPLVARVGAIFLDELDKASLEAQGGLLGLLDKPSGEYRLPGELTTIHWNGLIIAAATERIFRRVRSEKFLMDLFWRFDVRAHIVPVREMAQKQPSEFGRLFHLALRISLAKFGLHYDVSMSEVQVSRLSNHQWLGNLREVLELADSICVELKKSGKVPATKEIVALPECIFNKVLSRYEFFTGWLASGRAPGSRL